MSGISVIADPQTGVRAQALAAAYSAQAARFLAAAALAGARVAS